MNACRHEHKCTNCGALRTCDKPECQSIVEHDVCPTRCEGAATAPWQRHNHPAASDGRRRGALGAHR